jgi:stearoyl-CoA desaturase (Delta-9 desaturase)
MLDQKKVINWRNLLFFVFMATTALIGVPVYIYTHGLTGSDIAIFISFMYLTGFAITIGYHRLFAHRAFEAHPILKYLTLFFGAAAFQESLLQWTAQHRQHHKYVDTDEDPYNIKQGFWYAHIGWLVFRKHRIDFETVKDLSKDPVILHQHNHYVWWAVTASALLPLAIGALAGNMLGAFFIGVVGRITFVHHSTFMINSVCHYFGKSTYDRQSSPRDHWMVALVTMGEGYHSFHHRFPSDYRNGVKWYHCDPSKWIISLLSRVGLTRNLKRASEFHILSANLIAEKEYVEHTLARMPQKTQIAVLEALKVRYEGIKEVLHAWELSVKEHAALRRQGLKRSDEIRKAASHRARNARSQFLMLQDQWARFVEQPVLRLAFQS